MHQIRVHLRSLNHPIAGDRLYGGDSVAGLERLGLHARMLTLHLPAKVGAWKELDWGAASDEDVAVAIEGIERVTIQAPLPEDLRTALSQNRETAPLLAGNGGLW
jgi:23S rRNA-/tRNA-specific pseudouridylate synthase